jgi:hypothetical protein
MMNLLIQDNHLSWPLVAAMVYLTVLLLATDYTWRTSRLGGKAVFLGAGALGVLGCAMIFWLGAR